MTETGGGHPRDLLSSYLDDELNVEDRSAVDRHLAGCEDCRTALDGLRRLSRALAGESVPPPPVDLLAKIGRGLDAASVKPRRRMRYAIPATIAASLGAIGLLVALQWREGGIGELPQLGAPPTTAPEVPEAKQERQAVSDTKDKNAPPPPMPPPPPAARAASAGQVELDRLEDSRRDDALKKQTLPEAVAPALDESAKPSEQGVASGMTAGAPEPIAEAAGARERELKSNVATSPSAPRLESRSRCEDHWSDSGVHGAWEVPNLAEAGSTLETLARHEGGIGMGRWIADGQPYVLAVPRDHFGRVVAALRARGVTGLEGSPAEGRGDDCAGISVALTLLAPVP